MRMNLKYKRVGRAGAAVNAPGSRTGRVDQAPGDSSEARENRSTDGRIDHGPGGPDQRPGESILSSTLSPTFAVVARKEIFVGLARDVTVMVAGMRT